MEYYLTLNRRSIPCEMKGASPGSVPPMVYSKVEEKENGSDG